MQVWEWRYGVDWELSCTFNRGSIFNCFKAGYFRLGSSTSPCPDMPINPVVIAPVLSPLTLANHMPPWTIPTRFHWEKHVVFKVLLVYFCEGVLRLQVSYRAMRHNVTLASTAKSALDTTTMSRVYISRSLEPCPHHCTRSPGSYGSIMIIHLGHALGHVQVYAWVL